MIETIKREKNKMLLLLILLIICTCLFTSCNSIQETSEEAENNEPGRLVSFSYIYSNFLYRPFEYSIERESDEDGTVRIFFKAKGYAGELFSVEEEIEESLLDDIVKIIEEENIFAWDGFDKHNQEVRDGFSFELRATFENLNIKARGYMEEPENFEAGHERLSEYLFELAQSFR